MFFQISNLFFKNKNYIIFSNFSILIKINFNFNQKCVHLRWAICFLFSVHGPPPTIIAFLQGPNNLNPALIEA